MAPIHCRGSIGEQAMLNFSKSVLMKKQTHLHLGLPEGEFFFFFWGGGGGVPIKLSLFAMQNKDTLGFCSEVH